MQKIDGGVTAPKGFTAAGVYAGLKKKRNDMALILSEVPCDAAGVFTKNIVKAAPVKWDRELVGMNAGCQAVVINSGVANACTGTEGYGYCRETAEVAGKLFDLRPEQVLVASTGVIGRQLPMDKIKNGIALAKDALSDTREAAALAAGAIMTTDTKSKEVAYQTVVDGKTITVAGMCKGSGMIHPDMCTMLCFVTTDCAISHEMLQKALSEDVKDTFNMISVDGDMSTNDTVLVMANGLAENEKIVSEGADYDAFYEALHEVMKGLSKKIAGDGEGCTCLFEVTVDHASSKEQAVTLSKSVVCSNLTKAAIFGHDANWGRILAAMGYSGAMFDPDKTDIYFRDGSRELKIVEDGVATDYSEEEATSILSSPEVTCYVDIKEGNETATAWGCDLTLDYVRINADYRS